MSDIKFKLIQIARENLAIAEKQRYFFEGTDIHLDIENSIKESVYLPPERPIKHKPQREGKTKFAVIDGTTLDAALAMKLHDKTKSVLVLNFASARHPGGGFLTGAIAQEESLCRASVLFNCLNSAHVQTFYQNNIDSNDKAYSDAMIFSPNVPFFRNSNNDFLPEPIFLHVISCAGVNQSKKKFKNASQMMYQRIKRILTLASCCPRVVLGAFGCGVFKNNPTEIAAIFKQLLQTDFNNVFEEIVFAIYGNETCLEAFEFAFRKLEKQSSVEYLKTL
jgi:uncharacterized protein (TIGR02452 family)